MANQILDNEPTPADLEEAKRGIEGRRQLAADLEVIRIALYAGQISAAKVDAQRALTRILDQLRGVPGFYLAKR